MKWRIVSKEINKYGKLQHIVQMKSAGFFSQWVFCAQYDRIEEAECYIQSMAKLPKILAIQEYDEYGKPIYGGF